MASIERRERNGAVQWRAHYRTPAGTQRNKTFDRKGDAERFLASVESAKNAGSFVDPALAKVTRGGVGRDVAGRPGPPQAVHATYAVRRASSARTSSRRGDASGSPTSRTPTCRPGSPSCPRRRSPATVRKVHRVLSLILDLAVRDGRLARNVAEKINLPRPVRSEQRHLTISQVEDAGHASAATPSDVQQAPAAAERELRALPARRPVPRLHRRPVRRDGRAARRPPRPESAAAP